MPESRLQSALAHNQKHFLTAQAFEGFFTKKNVSQRIAEKIKFYVGDAKLDGSKTPEQVRAAEIAHTFLAVLHYRFLNAFFCGCL